MNNSLMHESSPYLLQHAHNPVNWYPWSAEALEKARQEDKLLLISIGYSACHWCHVMEQESFENEEIARIMNERYVCIKVDREERPDIDQIYMNAVQLMTGQGGWPLNCFTLPDQRPIYGGTYFPPGDWKQLLLNLDEFFRAKREEAESYAEKLTAGIRSVERLRPVQDVPTTFSEEDLKAAYAAWKPLLDFREGGNARAPKFPLPNNFQFLLRHAHFSGDPSAREIVKLTLDKLCRGGIYDQIGGGFARYSVDGQWHVPHFEKMLYDNGQLVSLYAEGYTYYGDEQYRRVIEESLQFIVREMTSPEGGFYSALDADSEGVEGKFYCWTREEIVQSGIFPDSNPDSASKKELELFCRYFDIRPQGNWEGTNVLRRLHKDEDLAAEFGMDIATLRETINRGRELLLQRRGERTRPGLDDKIMASWNAIMLKGYLDAYRALGTAEFLSVALKNARFIREKLMTEEGQLLRSYKDGKARIAAFLDDYAFVAQAFIALYEASFDEDWLQAARQLTETVIRDFYDESNGMFYYTSAQSTSLIDRKKELMDNVIPASNSVLAQVLDQLGLCYDLPSYRRMSRQMLANMVEPVKGYVSGYSNWAMLLQNQVYGFYQVAITGPKAAEKRQELDRLYRPNKIVLGGSGGTLPLLEGKDSDDTLIYVCKDETCQLPVKEVSKCKFL